MGLTHKRKVKMARKMMTAIEIKKHTPKFQSKAWEERKAAIKKRLVVKK